MPKKKTGPTISEHKKGGFYTTLTINGKKKFIYGATEEEVLEKYIEAKYKSGQGYNITDNPLMIDYTIRWFDIYKKNRHKQGKKKLSINTLEMYANIINNHIIPQLGHKRVKEIVTSDIQTVLNNASSSRSLQHKVRITLNQIFNIAISDRLISFNPVIGTEPIETPEPERLCYTPEQRNILLYVLHDHGVYPLIFTILHSGLRATEAIALMKIRDLDLENNKIYVRESTEFNKNQPRAKDTKTKRGVRTVPIPSTFADWLKEYLKTNKSLYVFPGHDGGQMKQSELKSKQRWANNKLKKWFDTAELAQKKRSEGEKLTKKEKEALKVIDALNIDDISEHRCQLHFKTLRHTYCTELFDLGIDENSAAAIMGHSVTVMREIYTHIQKKRKEQTVEKIENLYDNIIQFPLLKSAQ